MWFFDGHEEIPLGLTNVEGLSRITHKNELFISHSISQSINLFSFTGQRLPINVLNHGRVTHMYQSFIDKVMFSDCQKEKVGSKTTFYQRRVYQIILILN